jgi:Gluconate 2-dehydrogenase subunit 3
MNRRYAIRQILVSSAGMLIVPSCLDDRSKASFLLKNYELTGGQEKMLAELAETIIPKTNTPGAKDVYAHQFVMKMMDDCASKEEQQTFVKGLDAFDSFAKKISGTSFLDTSTSKRANVLKAIEGLKPEESDAAAFYKKMKSLTIRAYSSSQYYLTQVQVYELVPGRWSGCVPVKQSA